MCYKATRVRTWSDSRYVYTETSFYSVTRGGSLGFEKIPVDGSVKMPDDLMDSLEPFDFSKAEKFQTAYLAGYLADKYDVDAQESANRANDRIRKSSQEVFDASVTGYATVTKENSSILLKNRKVHYALLPVWILNTTWNGGNYLFAMNGQTDKMAGDLPLDKTAYTRWLFGLTGAIGGVLYAILCLFYLL